MSATTPDHYRNHPTGFECIDIGWTDPTTIQMLRPIPDTTPTWYNISAAPRNPQRGERMTYPEHGANGFGSTGR